MYLPHSWAEDPEQRKRAKIAAEVTFRTKPQIALEQIRTAKAEGVAPGGSRRRRMAPTAVSARACPSSV
ncbi:transposase [Mesorhizobium sp. M0204]|uniref:transposase n=1 Tax=Mesorhizobium sp. M0204 TaxID=2956913 RepID=UPI00333D5904